jgi:hypothetical protein
MIGFVNKTNTSRKLAICGMIFYGTPVLRASHNLIPWHQSGCATEIRLYVAHRDGVPQKIHIYVAHLSSMRHIRFFFSPRIYAPLDHLFSYVKYKRNKYKFKNIKSFEVPMYYVI